MAAAEKKLPTEEEIIARFDRLHITIGLSATGFGYTAIGVPQLIKRLREGHTLHGKNLKRCGYVLDELEKGHSVPFRTVNGKRTLIDKDEAKKDSSPRSRTLDPMEE